MIETLVASSVALIAPYLGKASEEAAKTVGKEGATAGLTERVNDFETADVSI